MDSTKSRQKLRAILAGPKCVSPAAVFDPLSARIAQSAGFEAAVLTGAAAAYTTLGAPDLSLLTLTEFADQIRRICRASQLSLIVDADHGYGNALNVMRTVQELECAGLSGLTLEDTVLPARYGQSEGTLELISVEEMAGKLRAAVTARCDPSLVIVGRTSLRTRNLRDTIARCRAYAGTGIDALFIVGCEAISEIEAIRSEIKLPLMSGPIPSSLRREELEAHGVRMLLEGHQPLLAALKTLTETYMHLVAGGDVSALEDKLLPAQQLKSLVGDDRYRAWKRQYLR